MTKLIILDLWPSQGKGKEEDMHYELQWGVDSLVESTIAVKSLALPAFLWKNYKDCNGQDDRKLS